MAEHNDIYTAEVDRVSEREWNALLDGFADASIYQSWAYGAVGWGERQLSHLVVIRDGDPVAMAQLRVVRVPLVRAGIAYVRWGPMWTRKGRPYDSKVWQIVVDALVEEYVRRRRLTLRVVPFLFRQDAHSSDISAIQRQAGFTEAPGVRPYRTLRVDLRPTADVLRSRLDAKWRNKLNGAERNGLEVAEGTDGSLFAEFMSLYREMMARKRFETTVSVSQFQRIQDRLPTSQKMVILIARRDGRAVSGLVASTVGKTGIYLLGATGDEGMKAKGSYLLQWQLLKLLKDCGCELYDLGGINPVVNPGVFQFKQGLGGEELIQIGPYDLHTGRLSRLCLTIGERLITRGTRLASHARNAQS